MKIPNSVERVPRYTSSEINQAIRAGIMQSIEKYRAASTEDITRRLKELDEEWDIERAIEANAATVSLLGLGLAAGVNRRWLALPIAVGGFLLQHAIQGWCPPVPILRRLGFRTTHEIEEERYALKCLRGDFEGVSLQEGERMSAEDLYYRVTHRNGTTALSTETRTHGS